MTATIAMGLFALTILIGVFGLTRNDLVFKARMEALYQVHLKNAADLNMMEDGVVIDPEVLYSRYKIIDEISYTAMMFHLNKWTFKDFYPDLKEQLKDK